MKKVLVPIANGSEEIESVCIIDTLRRAGADVTGALAAQHGFCGGCAQLDSCAVASVEATREVTCSRSVRILADALITDCLSSVYDLIALPGPPPPPNPTMVHYTVSHSCALFRWYAGR